MFTACFGVRLLLQSYQYPNLSECADRVGGQLRGDKECPFSGVTKSGRVCREVPESDARSVLFSHTPSLAFRHLSPNSAITGYASDGSLLISAYPCPSTVSASPRNARGSNTASKYAGKHKARPPQV